MSLVRIEIDGVVHEVEAGQNLLSACLGAGVLVPHFCWHEALGSVGACRLCAVRIFTGPDDGTGRIDMACMSEVADGLRVESLDREAADMRASVIEWLMVNHPHDCAVCEEGGACHLQDMTVASGHYKRRYAFTKRTHRNQDLGPFLTHEMNRCIACYRCVRFYRDYAGGHDLDVFGAHDRVYFGRAEDGPLESPFAGNLAEICPTGVFNDKPASKRYVRKWDLAATPSVCGQCSVGCNIFFAERDGEVRRVQNRRHREINGHFLCDRGRFGALHVAAPAQLTQARVHGEPASPEEARAAARTAIAEGAVAVGSPRAALETNFALRRLVGPARFFAGVAAREARAVARMAALLANGPARPAALADIETADAAIVLGEDLTGTAPRAALALRQSARVAGLALAAKKGVPGWLDAAARTAGEGRRSPIALITPLADALDDVAAWPLRRAPADVAAFGSAVADVLEGAACDDPVAHAVAAALEGAAAPAVVAGFGLGRPDIIEAAGRIAAALGAKARLAFFPPEANSIGLAAFAGGALQGLEGAVESLERGAAKTAIIAENDLYRRADHRLVERLRAAAKTLIVIDSEPNAFTACAEILLPAANIAESAGTFVNHEGRAQRFFAACPARRQAPWRVVAALCDPVPDWTRLDDVLSAMAADVPTLAAAKVAAPDAGFRTPLGEIARAPWRLSGRTAHDLPHRFPKGAPPDDPDSPLAFSMEGAHGTDAPPALRTDQTAPGMHSASAVDARPSAPGTPCTPAPGAAILPDLQGRLALDAEPAEEGAEAGAGFAPLYLHDPFAGDECAEHADALAERRAAPVIALNPADADALGLDAGADVVLDNRAGSVAPLTRDAAIPRGHVGVSARRLLPRGLARRVAVEARR